MPRPDTARTVQADSRAAEPRAISRHRRQRDAGYTEDAGEVGQPAQRQSVAQLDFNVHAPTESSAVDELEERIDRLINIRLLTEPLPGMCGAVSAMLREQENKG